MSSEQDSLRHRAIRSFVLREGKLTKGQQNALQTMWPEYGVDFQVEPLDFDDLFGRKAKRVLEIGFGNGMSLATMAAAEPEADFFGIEVHRPGVGGLLVQMNKQELTNIRVSKHDAVEVLAHQVPDATLDRLQIFFPDPWHKKRHHKRRLINAEFMQMVVPKLKPNAKVHIATDWQNYAEQILQVLEQASGLTNTVERYSKRPDYRPLTKYEHRGHRLGHGVWDVIFAKNERL
ncbi:MAG: tRNA (guanosine(46)-N7)-methyltransferase TrmB [Pseudomonadota bacterium]